MHTPLTNIIATQRLDELQRSAVSLAAGRGDATGSAPERNLWQSVTLRPAGIEDGRRLAVLAELDSSGRPTGPILLAEVEGELVAAIDLEQGTVIADPFQPTHEVVTLLRARARHLSFQAGTRSWRRRWIPSRRRVWAWR